MNLVISCPKCPAMCQDIFGSVLAARPKDTDNLDGSGRHEKPCLGLWMFLFLSAVASFLQLWGICSHHFSSIESSVNVSEAMRRQKKACRQRSQSSPARLESRQDGRVTEARNWKKKVRTIVTHFDMINMNENMLQHIQKKVEIQNLQREKSISDFQAHKAGTCKPCAYFFAKADGCRWHNSCEFCRCPR